MLHDLKKNTLTLAMLLAGIGVATAVQAGDIQPLHHSCYAGNSINWPKPVGAGSPGGAGTSLTVTHGGSGFLGTPTTAFDKIRFTCPVGTNSFEINVRMKPLIATTPHRGVRAMHMPPLPNPPWYLTPAAPTFITDFYAAAIDGLRWNQPASTAPDAGPSTISVTTPAGQQFYDVKVDKIGGGLGETRRYELCVQCYSGENESGTPSQPLSSIYLING